MQPVRVYSAKIWHYYSVIFVPFLIMCILLFLCLRWNTGGRVKHMWPEVNKSGGLIVCACDNTSVGVIYGSVYA